MQNAGSRMGQRRAGLAAAQFQPAPPARAATTRQRPCAGPKPPKNLQKLRQKEAGEVLTRAVSLDSTNARTHYFLALAQAAQGMLDQPLQHYSIACSLQPAVDTVPELHYLLSVSLARAGQTQEALRSARKALELAKARGDTNLVGIIKARMEDYRPKSKSN